MSVLMLDVGGTNIKMMIAAEREIRKIPSGSKLTPNQMISGVLSELGDWKYEKVSIGYPGRVKNGKPASEPSNLGDGWQNFDYEAALGKPVRFINDAAMQALGNYNSGRLLFIGLGTSIGTALIADDIVMPFEIGEELISHAKFMKRVTKAALKRNGKRRWNKAVYNAVMLLEDLFFPDETILGGGNAALIDSLPASYRRVSNQTAYRGALRLWEDADLFAEACTTTWQIRRVNNQ